MNATHMVLVLALATGGCATALKVPPVTPIEEPAPEPMVEGDLTPEEQVIAFLEDELAEAKKELDMCADDNLTSMTLITNLEEHIAKLRRSQKWKTTREWLRIGAGFAVGYAAGDN